jgi:hypothetical protein
MAEPRKPFIDPNQIKKDKRSDYLTILRITLWPGSGRRAERRRFPADSQLDEKLERDPLDDLLKRRQPFVLKRKPRLAGRAPAAQPPVRGSRTKPQPVDHIGGPSAAEIRIGRSTAFRAVGLFRSLAGEPGFEPRQTESESVVLPLHHSPPKTLI